MANHVTENFHNVYAHLVWRKRQKLIFMKYVGTYLLVKFSDNEIKIIKLPTTINMQMSKPCSFCVIGVTRAFYL